MSRHSPELIDYVRKTNEAGGTYHRIDFGDGLVLEGQYDITRYLDRYGFPEDLSGKKALDVGTSTGFFALEFARRGGEVTAIDIWEHHPLPLLAQGFGVDVRYVQQDLYELGPEFGEFDLVFCGSVLLHLWDQFNALRAMRSVCRGRTIVATAVMPPPGRFRKDRRALAELVAHPGGDGQIEYWATWLLSEAALVKLMEAAGFREVEPCGTFTLESEPGYGHEVLHGVVQGRA